MTIEDIARESGYAISTVSRALNNHPDVSPETRRKIQEIVERSGFVPNSNARQLKVQSNKSILLIVKGASNTFFAGIVERMQSLVSDRGYFAEVHYIDEDANEVAVSAQLRRERKPLGIVFLGGNIEFFERHFSECSLPCVLSTTVSPSLRFQNLSQVGVDDAAAGRAAGECLLRAGHRCIGVIGGNIRVSYISRLRYEGFCRAFEAAVGPHPQNLLRAGNFSMETGYAAMKDLLEKNPGLTAVFCMSDLIAVGAMRAVRDAGLQVPRDVSVIGFDGLDICKYTDPRLCSIRQPQRSIAEKSVELLLEQIERGGAAQTLLLDSVLMTGESVGPCRAR